MHVHQENDWIDTNNSLTHVLSLSDSVKIRKQHPI